MVHLSIYLPTLLATHYLVAGKELFHTSDLSLRVNSFKKPDVKTVVRVVFLQETVVLQQTAIAKVAVVNFQLLALL